MVRILPDQNSKQKPHDPIRRRLLILAAMAAAAASRPRRAWAQSAEMSRFDRTIRSLRNWWDRLTREPDEGDEEAKDTVRYVSKTSLDPKSWSDGGITLTWIGHSTFLIAGGYRSAPNLRR